MSPCPSFLVLGLRWLSNIRARTQDEEVGREYAMWWLFYLLLITCVPFTSIVVGRFAELAPAVWLYAGNTFLIALVAFRLTTLTPDLEPGSRRERQVSLMVLILSSLLAALWSFLNPPQALWLFALNIAAPALARWKRG